MGDVRQYHLGQSKGPLPEPLGYVLHVLERAGLAPDQLDLGKWVLERELARMRG